MELYMDNNKQKALDAALGQIERQFGKGSVMRLGDAEVGDAFHLALPSGPVSIYVVTDQPDALHDRAVAAGATIVTGLRDEEYGSRGFSATDPEGNLWSFGTYSGE